MSLVEYMSDYGIDALVEIGEVNGNMLQGAIDLLGGWPPCPESGICLINQ